MICEHVVDFFETEQDGWRPMLDGLGFESIEPHDGSWLERPFEEVEAHDVVRRIVKDKAPGSDDFSMGFFQTYWEVVKEDLM